MRPSENENGSASKKSPMFVIGLMPFLQTRGAVVHN